MEVGKLVFTADPGGLPCVVPQQFTPCFIIRPYWSYLSDGASYEKILPFSFAISLILVTLFFRILNMQLFPTYNSDL